MTYLQAITEAVNEAIKELGIEALLALSIFPRNNSN